jgi:hypothetical protein
LRAHRNASKWYKEYGSIVKIEIYGIKLIFLLDPRDIETVLRPNSKDWPARESHNLLKYLKMNKHGYENGGLLPE